MVYLILLLPSISFGLAILTIVFLDKSLKLFHLVGGGFITLGLWLSLSNKKKLLHEINN